MRPFLTIFLLLAINSNSWAQNVSNVTLETNVFTIEFPGIPKFECDTLNHSSLIVKHAYTLEGENDQSYSIVYRDRMEDDNKHDTFQSEMDWLSYWTLPEISQKKKGKLNGYPTLSFIAKTSTETIHFRYILTKSHFIRIGTNSENESLAPTTKHFFDSFTLKE
ncbi:hypothetical protein OAK35_02555 [Crocinitomicaceae bacterium]|nr:hypothetical protein [Crocinitomicaceae bacterium]